LEGQLFARLGSGFHGIIFKAVGNCLFFQRLYNLRRDKNGSQERPPKPVLLLSIIDLLGRGVITRNEVPLCDEPTSDRTRSR